ncbi:hypothetical protein [Erwinia mallotivora]|uniref:hypothetical protein n=1 Tax=Erwinia mallotivora TaxID=69222 RepID=UPI0021BFA657|nr:hypothetical protein [Erwinia mallotivora]
MHKHMEKTEENKKSVADNMVAKKKGRDKKGLKLMDHRAETVAQKKVQDEVADDTRENQSVVQRIVRQSDFLKFKRIKDEEGEVGIYRSHSSLGPWAKINDKTRASYRDAASEILGSKDILHRLAFHNVIVERNNGDRNPYTNSHLIGAAFGGQLKYTNSADNIRYHPESVEYGKWQEDETLVEKKARTGYITTASYDSNAGVAAKMASEIVGVIREDLTSEEINNIENELKKMLKCVEYIPPAIVFRYNDIEDPDLNFRHQWNNVNAGLQLSSSTTKKGVYKTLVDMNIMNEDKVPVDIRPDILNVSSRSEVIALLKMITVSGTKRMKTIIDGINSKFKLADNYRSQVLGTFIMSQPEFKALGRLITIDASFGKDALYEIKYEDVKLNK